MIKILVVDDEPGVCDAIKKVFTYIGFTVFIATTANKAIELMKKEKPKIIFLDILMPDGNGLDLLKQIKRIDNNTVVLIVTGKKDKETREKALQLGADEFIGKPCSVRYLRDVVAQKIEKVMQKKREMEKPSILIVDDMEDARKTLVDFISKRFDADIYEAENASTGLDAIKNNVPDIIFLDINMPGSNGIDMIKEIKEITQEPKIIVVSAWKSGDVVKKAIDTGANDFIFKPLQLSIFRQKLREHLVSIGKLIPKNP